MENPRWSYDNMVREAYRVINWNKKIDECSEVEDLELRLKACDHDNNFYFDCGIAVSNVVYDIYMNGNCDEMKAMVGSLGMFKDLIGLENSNGEKI